MQATERKKPEQDSGRQSTDLDRRYGKIGISAVAAAVSQHGQPSAKNEVRRQPAESD